MHSVLGQSKQWQKQYIAIGKTDLFYNSMGLWGTFTTSTFKRLTYKFENLTKAGKTNLNKNPSEHYVYLIMLITSYTNYFELVDATCLHENIWGWEWTRSSKTITKQR